MTRARHALLAFVCVMALACGGGSEEDDVATALAENLRGDRGVASSITGDEARCVGDSLVDSLGVDDASDLARAEDGNGFDLVALDEDDVDAIGTAMESCIDDLGAIVADRVAADTLALSDEQFPVGAESAECIGETVAGGLSFGRLLAIRVAAEADGTDQLDHLTEDERRIYARAYSDCIDVRSIILDGVRADGTDEEVARCIEQQITDDDIEQQFVALFAGDETSADEAFEGAIEACTGESSTTDEQD